MALIICPECGKQISDKAPACIHCGCPIEAETMKKEDTSLYDILSEDYKGNKSAEVFLLTSSLKHWYGIPKEHTKECVMSKPGSVIIPGVKSCNVDYLVDQFKYFKCNVTVEKSNSPENETVNSKIEQWKKEEEEAKKPPKCPKCGSPHIVTGQRGHSLLTGFLGSNKTVNRCSKCGYSWEPKR